MSPIKNLRHFRLFSHCTILTMKTLRYGIRKNGLTRAFTITLTSLYLAVHFSPTSSQTYIVKLNIIYIKKNFGFDNLFSTADPKDPKLIYTWQDVGVLDYDMLNKLWLVQQLSSDERILDENNKPVVNKGLRPDGKCSFSMFFI